MKNEGFIDFLALSIVCFLVGIHKLIYVIKAKNKNNIKVKGKVKKEYVIGSSKYQKTYYEVEFEYEGIVYLKCFKFSTKNYKVGDNVTVIFDKNTVDKKEWIYVEEESELFFPVIFLILGLLALIAEFVV